MTDMSGYKLTDIVSDEPGPSVVVVAGIHGDERAGIHAIELIERWACIFQGRLRLINYANPAACREWKRESKEGDLNRLFPDGSALAMKVWSDVTEVSPTLVISLHSAPSGRQNVPHVLFTSGPVADDYALMTGVKFVVKSTGVKGMLRRELWDRMGIVSLTIESGRGGSVTDGVDAHVRTVQNILVRLGMSQSYSVEGNTFGKRIVIERESWVDAGFDCFVTHVYAEVGVHAVKGEPLVRIDGETQHSQVLTSPSDGYILGLPEIRSYRKGDWLAHVGIPQ